jgi:glycosyltransferase involved in cell wall biosynthesis
VSDHLNVVIAGVFPYPRGMATTRRIQRVVDGLKPHPDVSVRVVSLRQSIRENEASGFHEGTPYETVRPSASGAISPLALPSLWTRARARLKTAWQENQRNVLYKYSSPTPEDVVPTARARSLGYKVVFDLIEDHDTAARISGSVKHRLKIWLTQRLLRRIGTLADGVVVISTHLETKIRTMTRDRLPVHLQRVSVDLGLLPDPPRPFSDSPRLFYSGSFGEKDGIDVLLGAFEKVAAAHPGVRLVLTGKGEPARMTQFLERAERSPAADRIEYRGYLSDRDYYSLLNEIDIPCITRIDTEHAHAGFPFKLGEFMAAGKPVVASRVSDIPSLLTDGVDAMLVPPGSVDAVADAIEFLLAHPADALRMAERARATAATHFDHVKQGRDLRTFLRRVASLS